MRIKTRDNTRWHKTFALMPRKIGNTWVWLERYWCRWNPSEIVSLYPHHGYWEYRCTETRLVGGELCEIRP